MPKLSYPTDRRQRTPSTRLHGARTYHLQRGFIRHPYDLHIPGYCTELRPLAGGTNAAILLTHLFYWKDKQHDPAGWLYKTQAQLREDTGLTRGEQERARRKLRDRGLLEERYRDEAHGGLCYRLNLAAYDAAWRRHYGPPDPPPSPRRPRRPPGPATLTTADTPQPPNAATSAAEAPIMPPETAENSNDFKRMLILSIETAENPNEIERMFILSRENAQHEHSQTAENSNEISMILEPSAPYTTTNTTKDFFTPGRECDIRAPSMTDAAAEKKGGAHAPTPAAATPPAGPTPRAVRTPAPTMLPITEDLRAWAAKHTPGLDLAHERNIWLQHCRAKHYTFIDWPEEFKGSLLKAYHRRTQGNGHRAQAPKPPTPPDDSPPRDEAYERWQERWNWKYDLTLGADAPPPAARDGSPIPLPPSSEERTPQDALSVLIAPLTDTMSFPERAAPGRPTAAPETERQRLVREAREGSRGRSGEADERERQLLEQAREARYAGRLTAEQLGAFKTRLREAPGLPELTALAAEIAAASGP